MLLGATHTPPIELPVQEVWRTHCETLANRAEGLQDPVAVARCLHELGWTHAEELGDLVSATTAWRAALAACPTQIPTLIALRHAAV